jgi:hypothetical protein
LFANWFSIMHSRRFWQITVGILVSLVALAIYAAVPGSSTFTVSPETTFVTGPLDKRGHVDYVAALNERLRKGITPETNSNVLIWKALGPHPEGGTMPAEYFEWLGVESPPEEGDYLVGWGNYLKENPKLSERNKKNPEKDPMIRGREWLWTAKDEPEFADYLNQNEKPLAVVAEATRRPEYYNPMVPKRTEDQSGGLIGSLIPQVQKCREIANALTCRAMLRVAEGKTKEAWHDLLTCHRLGRLLARGGTIIEMLVGIAIDQIADGADVIFLDHTHLTSQQIMACLEDLRRLPPMSALADKMDLGERFMLLDTMMMVAQQGPSVHEDLSKTMYGPAKNGQSRGQLFTFNTNWDPALRNANSWFDRYVAALRIIDRPTRLQEMASITEDLKELKQQVDNTDFIDKTLTSSTGRGEMIGNTLITLMLPGFEKVQAAVDRCEQAQGNLHLAFALAAYKADHNRYPAKLKELSPKYVSNIPDDLFSGSPPIYRPEGMGYLLYSVGPNGKDDSGHGPEDDPRGDDITVRIPVPEPKVKE